MAATTRVVLAVSSLTLAACAPRAVGQEVFVVPGDMPREMVRSSVAAQQVWVPAGELRPGMARRATTAAPDGSGPTKDAEVWLPRGGLPRGVRPR